MSLLKLADDRSQWGVLDRVIGPIVNLLGLAGGVGLAALLADLLATGREARAAALTGMAAVVTLLALNPAVGMLGWLALAPFSRVFNLTMGRGLPDLSLSRVAAAFLLFLLIAQVAIGQRRLARLTAVEVVGGLFIVGMLLSVPASRLGTIGGVQNVFDTAALPLLGFFFARNLLADERGLTRLAVLLALIGALLGLVAAREQLTNQAFLSPVPYRWAYGQHSIKVTSFFGAPAIMAFTLTMTFPVTFLALAQARTWASRVFFAAAFAAISAGLLLTYVRAGWLSALVALAVLIVLAPRARRYVIVLAPAVLLVALLAVSGAFDTRALTERLQTEGSISYRTDALEVGLAIARRAPIFGLGLDNYSDAAIAAGWQPQGGLGLPTVAPHNLFVYVMTSAGLVGLLPLVLLFGLIAWAAFRGWLAGPRTGVRPSPSTGGFSQTALSRLPAQDASGAALRGWAAALLATLAGYALFANTFDALGAQLANMLFFTLAGAVLGTTATRMHAQETQA